MELDNPLWQGACKLYQHEGVAQACLGLQTYGYSVNLVLAAVWCGQNGYSIDSLDVFREQDNVYQWRFRGVEEVRNARFQMRELKAQMSLDVVDVIYERLKAIELQCEQVELALIYQAIRDRVLVSSQLERSAYPDKELIRENLDTYLNAGKLCVDLNILEHASVICEAACA